MLEKTENPVCAVVLVFLTLRWNLNGAYSLTGTWPKTWTLAIGKLISDCGWFHSKFDSHAWCFTRSFSKVLPGNWSIAHVYRDYLLFTLIWKHSRSLKNKEIFTPVTIRKKYNFTLDFLIFIHTGVGLQPKRLSSIFHRGSIRGFLLVLCFHDNSRVSANQSLVWVLGYILTNVLKIKEGRRCYKKEVLNLWIQKEPKGWKLHSWKYTLV